MVFNATFGNISVIPLPLILLVGETGIAAENHRSTEMHRQTLSYNVVSNTRCPERDLNSQH
jgi:hypothetical protein